MVFMQITKKTGVTIAIQATLVSSEASSLPSISPLDRLTDCVRGSTALANICSAAGYSDSEKKVPLSRNIGVMKRNPG